MRVSRVNGQVGCGITGRLCRSADDGWHFGREYGRGLSASGSNSTPFQVIHRESSLPMVAVMVR